MGEALSMEELTEQERADLWQELENLCCHRLNWPELDRAAFKAFVEERIAREAKP
jgi:hypothetical protein